MTAPAFDFAPLSEAALELVGERGVELFLERKDHDEYEVQWTNAIMDAECGVDPMPTIRRAFQELRASRAALRKVVEASCTDEEIAALKTARALVAHVGGGGE